MWHVDRTIRQHRERAADLNMTKQALSAGLLDELHLDLVPVLFGEGVRFLDDFEEGPIRLERMRLVDTPAVAHVSFRVLRA